MVITMRKDNVETALLKTTDGKFYVVTGWENQVLIPDDLIPKLEVHVHTHKLKSPESCSISGSDVLLLHGAVNTIRKCVLICVGDSTETFKIYSLKEDKREAFRKYLESILNDELKYLEYLYDLVNKECEEDIRQFFNITTCQDAREMLKDVFGRNAKRRVWSEATRKVR